jgi:hypothetical protein
VNLVDARTSDAPKFDLRATPAGEIAVAKLDMSDHSSVTWKIDHPARAPWTKYQPRTRGEPGSIAEHHNDVE